jgi:hypothetical protein
MNSHADITGKGCTNIQMGEQNLKIYKEKKKRDWYIGGFFGEEV